VVARKLVEDFENVVAKQPILILQDDTRFKIRVTVPEQDLAGGRPEFPDFAEITQRIQPRVTVTSLPDSEFSATLYELALTADPVTRTFDATFLMDAPQQTRVLPGMTAKVTINSGQIGGVGISIPGVAVWADEAETSYVWKLDPGSNQVHRTAVQVGGLSGRNIEILSGLGKGDTVVTSGVHVIAEGQVVRPLGERLR
jgi:RND family efflux transporter MFP subunit